MDSQRTPRRLNKNPLIDVSAEIRFESDIPAQVIVGLVFADVKDVFGAPKALPITQLPSALIEKDPNLRYQSQFRFEAKGHTLLLGPRNIAIGTNPYVDWATLSPLLVKMYERFDRAGLFKTVERVGLRFINFLEGLNVFEHSTLTLAIDGASLASRKLMLRAEHTDGDLTTILQFTNVAATDERDSKVGSILDIDVVTNKILDGRTRAEALVNTLAAENHAAERQFFGVLSPDLIASFEPQY